MPKATKTIAKQKPAQVKGKGKASTKASTQASTKGATKAQTKKISPPVKAASKIIKKTEVSQTTASSSKKSQRSSKPPSKAASAFQFFNKQMKAQMNQMEKFKSMAAKQQQSVISESWKKLTAPQQEQYHELAKADKARFEKQQKQFDKKGYFIDTDGRDSRESSKPAKKVQSTKKVASKKDDKENSRKSSKAETKDEKCKPKRVCSVFIHYSNHYRVVLGKEHPDKTMCEITKLVSEKWKTATDADKKPFLKKQEEDQKRHDKETKQFNELGYFVNSDGVKSTFLNKKGKAQEFEIGTVMPKQVWSVFLFFIKEKREEIAKANPDKKGIEISKIAGELYRNLSDQEKKKYEEMQKKDMKRYDDQLAQLKKNGYFTTSDGTKSTDLPYKPPKVIKRKAKKVEEAE